ncbi:MAG TPA: sulfatase-like hydrolase/transferase [Mycobacteriales bacterium]|nr:sulfatase-like hydrolase/transferase [Mycobacteriales bacterium]
MVLIVSDQHRADCCEPYGNQQVRTPALSRLAADGTVYDNSFCAFPVCAPSRYSLLTGLYPRQHLALGNASTVPAGLPTFPRALRDLGYGTTTVGKMHLTPAYLDVGFEQMFLAEQDGAGRLVDDFHRHLRRHGLIDRGDVIDQIAEFRKNAPPEYWATFGALESDLPEEHHSTTWIGDRACEQIAAWDESRPQLLMVSFIKPHHPFDPPARWLQDYSETDLDPLPGWTPECLDRDLEFSTGYFPWRDLSEPALRRIMRHYYVGISHIDHQIGRITAALEQRGEYDDTLIVYTSDHGEYLGFHHMLLKGGLLYNPLARVPLIVKYPGRPGGRRENALVSGVDIAPTLVGAAGGEPFGSGHDLGAGPPDRELVVIEAPGPSHIMARSRTHKLILRPRREPLLFDLRADPLELTDLAADPAYREVRDSLQAQVTEQLLFGSPGTHRDSAAPLIRTPNVPEDLAGTEQEMRAWIRQQINR